MLIKNEISFLGVNGQQNYGVLVMIILYALSLFGCVLIAIILLKLIITCFFTDKCNQLFWIRSENKTIRTSVDRRRRVSDISVVSSEDSSKDNKFSNLESLFRKISETQLRAEQHCICPVCANDHLSKKSRNSTIMDSISTNIKKGHSKRSSFILRSAQVLSKKLILKKEIKSQTESDGNDDNKNEKETKKAVIIPIVSQTQTEKIILKKVDRPLGEVKQIANYGDVVLELKQKFSSMTMLNTIA